MYLRALRVGEAGVVLVESVQVVGVGAQELVVLLNEAVRKTSKD